MKAAILAVIHNWHTIKDVWRLGSRDIAPIHDPASSEGEWAALLQNSFETTRGLEHQSSSTLHSSKITVELHKAYGVVKLGAKVVLEERTFQSSGERRKDVLQTSCLQTRVLPLRLVKPHGRGRAA